nr:hypothetical protein [Methylomarinum sp. Ch1-1]MDP4521615.1 hypothetical protein [Methylomarinum sp. Ch1-1]
MNNYSRIFGANQKSSVIIQRNFIKNGALPIVSTPYRIVGRLREASRQKPPPGQNWPLCVSRRIAWRRLYIITLWLRCQCNLAFGCAEQREAHQKPVRFLSSTHPTRRQGP